MTGRPLPELAFSRLLLWRHGRTEWNATGRFQGQLDAPLDAEGREQAARTAPYLIASGLAAEETVVISSDLSRAAETAEALTALLGLPLNLDPRLREHGLGSWEGLTRDEVAARHPEQFADWLAGRPVQGRGGEDAGQVAERALAALAALPAVRTVVAVTHGGTAARVIEALLELGPERRRVFGTLGNCAWSELVLQRGHWRLMRHNSAAPRPLDGRASAPLEGAQGRRPGARPAALEGSEEGARDAAGDADAVL